MQPDHPIVIVGAGPAGCSAAIQCKRLGISPILLDQTGRSGGLLANAFRIENYPGTSPISGMQFAERIEEQLTEFSIVVETGMVIRISPSAGSFLLEGDFGSSLASSVLIAVGTEPIRLDIPGAQALENTRLFYEVSDLLSAWNRPARSVVIGGGEAAFDYSLSLAAAGAAVTIVVRNEQPRACERLVQMVADNPAIRVINEAEPKGVWEDEIGARVEVSTRESSLQISCDGILCAIGRRSIASSLMPDLAVGPYAAVAAREPGVFLIGDARLGGLGQIGIAVGDGLLAAQLAVAHVTSLES